VAENVTPGWEDVVNKLTSLVAARDGARVLASSTGDHHSEARPVSGGASERIEIARPAARGRGLSIVVKSVTNDLHVEGSVEQDDKQARRVLRGCMLHRLSRRKVSVCPSADDLAVGLQPSFEDDDSVRGRVPVQPTSEAGRVSNEVVLFTGIWILVQQP
jgi:hypothetical protein